MTPDPTHTLGAITPEYAEAGGLRTYDAVIAGHLFTLYPGEIVCDCEWSHKDDDSRAGERRMIAAHVAHLSDLVASSAAAAVLTAARDLCCGEHPSAHHAATDAHSRVMAIAERLADAARGLG